MTPASRRRAADVDRVRAVIRTRGSGYAIVGTPRRSRPRPEPARSEATQPRREPAATPEIQPAPAG